MTIRRQLLKNIEIDPITLCWLGPTAIKIDGKLRSSSRLSYYAFHDGFKMSDKVFVCHECDEHGCVRPDHLFLGTAKDNAQDCLLKNGKGSPFVNRKERPFIPILLWRSLFRRASRLTRQYNLKTIPDMIEQAFDYLEFNTKLPKAK